MDPERRELPELPEEVRQRIQAVVSAAHAQAAREQEAQNEGEAGPGQLQPDQPVRRKRPGKLSRRLPNAVNGAVPPEGMLPPERPSAQPREHWSDVDAEFDTAPLARLTASGAVASPEVKNVSPQPAVTAAPNGAVKPDLADKQQHVARQEQERARQEQERATQEQARLKQERAEQERERQKQESLARQERKRATKLERTAQRERATERRREVKLERERAAQELIEQKRAAEERARQEQERAAEELARQLEDLAAKERIRQEQDREDREWAAARRARLEREREEAEEAGEGAATPDGAARPAEPLPVPNSNGTGQPALHRLASFTPTAAGPARVGSLAQPQPRGPEVSGRRRYRMPALVAVVAVVLATGSLVGTKLATSGHNTAGDIVGTPTMNKAAVWVAQQVSAVVSCDPTMCLVLKAHGVPTYDLLAFEPKTRNRFGSAQIVVATPAIQHYVGSRLSSAYAPAVLASFGSGKSRIDIRVIAPDGARAYLSQLKADQQDRKTNGALLLGTNRIATSATARAQLRAGQVDSRLMIVISSLAAVVNQINVTGFGDAGPGATAGMPLRSATLTGSRASLRSIAAYLRTPEAPYRPTHVAMTQPGGKPTLVIEFAAPIPLNLFDNPSQ